MGTSLPTIILENQSQSVAPVPMDNCIIGRLSRLFAPMHNPKNNNIGPEGHQFRLISGPRITSLSDWNTEISEGFSKWNAKSGRKFQKGIRQAITSHFPQKLQLLVLTLLVTLNCL